MLIEDRRRGSRIQSCSLGPWAHLPAPAPLFAGVPPTAPTEVRRSGPSEFVLAASDGYSSGTATDRVPVSFPIYGARCNSWSSLPGCRNAQLPIPLATSCESPLPGDRSDAQVRPYHLVFEKARVAGRRDDFHRRPTALCQKGAKPMITFAASRSLSGVIAWRRLYGLKCPRHGLAHGKGDSHPAPISVHRWLRRERHPARSRRKQTVTRPQSLTTCGCGAGVVQPAHGKRGQSPGPNLYAPVIVQAVGAGSQSPFSFACAGEAALKLILEREVWLLAVF